MQGAKVLAIQWADTQFGAWCCQQVTYFDARYRLACSAGQSSGIPTCSSYSLVSSSIRFAHASWAAFTRVACACEGTNQIAGASMPFPWSRPEGHGHQLAHEEAWWADTFLCRAKWIQKWQWTGTRARREQCGHAALSNPSTGSHPSSNAAEQQMPCPVLHAKIHPCFRRFEASRDMSLPWCSWALAREGCSSPSALALQLGVFAPALGRVTTCVCMCQTLIKLDSE